MISATARNKDTTKPPLVIFCLLDANIALLKQDQPIVYNLRELNLDNYLVCLTYKHPDEHAALPKDFSGTVLAMGDEALARMQTGILHVDVTEASYVLFRADDMEMGREILADLIGPATLVRTVDAPPSDRIQFWN